MRLFLSCVPQDFDPSVDVAAGPWCFVSRPEDFEVWSDLDFIAEPGETGLDYRVAMDNCAGYAQRILARMAPELNHLNGTDYSPRFWEIRGMFWMLSLLQMVFLALARANALKERYGSRPMKVEFVTSEDGWSFANTGEFCNASYYVTDFIGWMLSRFLERSLPALWTVCHRPPSRPSTTLPKSEGFGKKLHHIKWAIRAFVTPRCLGIYGVHSWQAWLLSMLLSFKKPIVCAVQSNKLSYEEGRKKNTEGWLAPLTEEDVLSLAWETLPITLRALRRTPTIRWFRRKGKIRLVGGAAMIGVDEINLAVAESVEAGEYIIGSQHGACYGDSRQLMTAFVEYKLDAFITWGWSKHDGFPGRFIPLPSPLLSRGSIHQEQEETLFFVGQVVPLFNPRLDNSPDSVGFTHYVRMKKNFLDCLAPHIFKQLWYRDQPASGTLNDVRFLRKHFPTLNVLDHYPEDRFQSCRLLVMDNPSTTLHKALSANIPIVCYWTRNEWQMTREAEIFYDVLRDAGILFDDPACAAEHINRVWADVQGWWRSSKVQHAREEWCKQYALADADWFSVWAKTLWNLREL